MRGCDLSIIFGGPVIFRDCKQMLAAGGGWKGKNYLWERGTDLWLLYYSCARSLGILWIVELPSCVIPGRWNGKFSLSIQRPVRYDTASTDWDIHHQPQFSHLVAGNLSFGNKAICQARKLSNVSKLLLYKAFFTKRYSHRECSTCVFYIPT